MSAKPSGAAVVSPSLLDALSEEQQAAVRACFTRSTLVAAGPGAGKTRVLVARILYALEMGMQPEELVAVTFTNAAAQEMKDRIRKVTGPEVVRRLWVGTFHAMGARLLRRHAEAAGISPDFWIADESDQLAVLKSIGVLDREVDEVSAWIRRAKEELKGPEYVQACAVSEQERRFALYYHLYQARLADLHALDFGDLVMRAVELLQSDAAIRQIYHERFLHLLVDEWQDVNVAQVELINAMMGPKTTLFAVGDADQSIFGWRGSRPEYAVEFQTFYPDSDIVRLTQNYRSQSAVVQAADAVIRHNVRRLDRDLRAVRTDVYPIRLWTGAHPSEEARLVAAVLEREHVLGVPWRDMAVLFRTNHQAKELENALLTFRIPYHVSGSVRFWDHKEIRDALSLLYLLFTKGRPQDLGRLAKMLPGVGQKTADRLVALAEEQPEADAVEILRSMTVRGRKATQALQEAAEILTDMRHRAQDVAPSIVLNDALDALGYAERVLSKEPNRQGRLGRLALFTQLLKDAEEELGHEGCRIDFRDVADLLRFQIDEDADAGDEVRLMTIHRAKGKEWSVVLLVGCDEGVLPHRLSDSADALEEERRLFYVAITRAKDRLHLFRACERPLPNRGGMGRMMPSRFLREIPSSLYGS